MALGLDSTREGKKILKPLSHLPKRRKFRDPRRVYEQEVYRRDEITPQPGLQIRASIEIPATAMHSFRSEHNKVSWKLLVSGEVTRRGDFERSFLLHVYPCRFESRAA